MSRSRDTNRGRYGYQSHDTKSCPWCVGNRTHAVTRQAPLPDDAENIVTLDLASIHALMCCDCATVDDIAAPGGMERARVDHESEQWCEENDEFCPSYSEPLRVPLLQIARVR